MDPIVSRICDVVGASDTVYVLDGGNVRVQMFSLTGQADVPEFYMISSTVVAVAIGTIVAMFRFFRGRFF